MRSGTKSTSILGISAYYHDSAACLVRDGSIVAGAQEERFTRKKHDECYPRKAIDYCLREGGITTSDLDYVTFYEKPFVKFDRLLHSYLAYAPVAREPSCGLEIERTRIFPRSGQNTLLGRWR